tara:strand:+ start:1032 stop:1589 length:558 start_codon:yes stop_codon:yes gene_type:complete
MGYRTCKWNNEEETQLLEYVNDEVSWEDISRELNRSIPACKKRLKMLDKRLIRKIVANSAEVQEEIDAILTVDKIREVEEYLKPNVAETMWTKEQDFDILCNFYDLSIDEARERFNVSYSVIAGRLEELYEGKDEYSIEILLRASKFIKQRKGLLPTSSSTSKKEAKILKKIHKLQQKLKQVRDE